MKLKYLILSLAPLFVCLSISVIAYFAAFAMTVITGGVDTMDISSAMVNETIFSLFRYTLVLIFCGLWYTKAFPEAVYFRKTSVSEVLKKTLNPKGLIPIIILGYSIQIFTDSILYFISIYFKEFFVSYSEMMEIFEGSTSIFFILCVCTIGPIAEELVFRGLSLRYLMKAFPVSASIVIQALLFALYHGNIVQGCYAFLFGVIFGVIAVKSDSLIPSSLIHMITNASLYLVPEKLFKNSIAGYTTLFISLTLLIISFILLCRYFGNKAAVSKNDSHKATASKNDSHKATASEDDAHKPSESDHPDNQ